MSHILNSTPRKDGFRMPGEFEPHAGCWMLWPERPDNWRLNAAPAQQAFAVVAAAIAQFEPVSAGVSARQFESARRMLPRGVRVVELSSNDAWMRDCGPTFVLNERRAVRGVDWDFNAWGGLYLDCTLDRQVARKVLEIERLERYKAPLVMEGGAIHSDGQGTVLTTAGCLLNPNRNPQLSQAQIEDHLQEYLNARKVIWLPRGVFNDETSGHVDNLCCFARPGVVALAWMDDKTDPQYEISSEAYECLRTSTDALGRRLEVHKITQPAPVTITAQESAGVQPAPGTLPRQTGDRLAASYINFYIANGGVVMPGFDDPQDAPARLQLQALFPDRRVVQAPAREILLGGGGIHCITQQVPRGR